jgi:hypothetical protein
MHEYLTREMEEEIAEEVDHLPSPPCQPVGLLGGALPAVSAVAGTFADPLWHLYKRLKGVTWDRVGTFVGVPQIEARGGREYVLRQPDTDPFRFVRANGELVVPGAMRTDGGSVPRVAWFVPNLDPWNYMPAYLIHDWEFVRHHCHAGYEKSFAEVNQTLGEAVYTMMRSGVVKEDWRAAVVIVLAVSTRIAKRVWDAPWTEEACRLTLNV